MLFYTILYHTILLQHTRHDLIANKAKKAIRTRTRIKSASRLQKGSPAKAAPPQGTKKVWTGTPGMSVSAPHSQYPGQKGEDKELNFVEFCLKLFSKKYRRRMKDIGIVFVFGICICICTCST